MCNAQCGDWHELQTRARGQARAEYGGDSRPQRGPTLAYSRGQACQEETKGEGHAQINKKARIKRTHIYCSKGVGFLAGIY